MSIKPTEKTTSAVDGCPVPLQIRIMGRAGKVELTVEPGTAAAHTQNGGFIIASVSSQAIGDMVQVCLIAGSPMAVGQQFEVDTLTVHTLLPEVRAVPSVVATCSLQPIGPSLNLALKSRTPAPRLSTVSTQPYIP